MVSRIYGAKRANVRRKHVRDTDGLQGRWVPLLSHEMERESLPGTGWEWVCLRTNFVDDQLDPEAVYSEWLPALSDNEHGREVRYSRP